jgi:hypothetical protein
MKTFEFSQRAILLASILFLAGFVSLVFTELSREYVAIIFVCVPVCLMAQVVTYEASGLLDIGLAFSIYHLDTNLYIAKFFGAEGLLNYSGWVHWVGVLLTGFISLTISVVIVWFFNSKFLDTTPCIKEGSEET